jgi:hypothetical protein
MARVTANDDLLGDSETEHYGEMGNRTHLQRAQEQRSREIEAKETRDREKRARENRVRRSQNLPPIGDDADEEINVRGIGSMRILRRGF